MALTATHDARRRRGDEREYRIFYVISFLLLLPIVTLVHLIPRPWRPRLTGSSERLSVFGETRQLINSTIPFAFMG